MCSVADEAMPGSPGMQALLDAPTPQWEGISDTSLELLSDLHFGTQSAEQPPPVDASTMQVTCMQCKQMVLKHYIPMVFDIFRSDIV